MGALPYLSASFRQRFALTAAGAEPTEQAPDHPLMLALQPILNVTHKALSPVGKLDAVGNAVQDWGYELPPMEVTAMLVNTYHVTGAAPRDTFPYATKAVGLVDPHMILRGGKGLITDNLVIVP